MKEWIGWGSALIGLPTFGMQTYWQWQGRRQQVPPTSLWFFALALIGTLGQLVYSGHSPDGITSWGDMALLQKREITAHFVSGWTDARIEQTLRLMADGSLPTDQLVGTVARTAAEIDDLAAAVIAGRTSSLASVIDWTSL